MKLEISNIKMPLDRKGKNYVMAHLFLIAIALIGWGVLLGEYWYHAGWPISIGFLFIIGIILISLADYLDILELRKSVVRHTKFYIVLHLRLMQ